MTFTRTEAFWLGLLLGILCAGLISTLIFVFMKIVIGFAVLLLAAYFLGKVVQHAISRAKPGW